PLVVAGVNDHHLSSHRGIIANPNCTTMALMVAAGPLHRTAGLRSIVASSYQAVSGSGAKGVDELLRQTQELLADPEALRTGEWKDPGSEVYARPIAFNALPYAGTETELGYTDEEWKLVNESRKILEAPALDVEPTCVRVPAVAGHGIAATLRFERPVTLDEAMEVLSDAPGGELWKGTVPTALDAAGRDEVLIGRVRPTLGEPGRIGRTGCGPGVTMLWVVGDSLRRGAALATVELAESL